MSFKNENKSKILESKNTKPSTDILEAKKKFNKEVIRHGALAMNDITADNYDFGAAKEECKTALVALGAGSSLQEMITAQMLSIHNLQQKVMIYANSNSPTEKNQYYINSAIKLTNCFTQQAALLAKLQGDLAQTMTVKRVDVHSGGQAVVGNVSGLNQSDKGKK